MGMEEVLAKLKVTHKTDKQKDLIVDAVAYYHSIKRMWFCWNKGTDLKARGIQIEDAMKMSTSELIKEAESAIERALDMIIFMSTCSQQLKKTIRELRKDQ